MQGGSLLTQRQINQLLDCLAAGVPPPPRLAAHCLVGLDKLLSEWTRDLESYVATGGSLLRIVVSPPGSGKTHLGAALKATAAERGFLVCQIDAQAQQTHGDDLVLYRSFCSGLRLSSQYLDGLEDEGGLQALIEDIAERMDDAQVREALRPIKMPIPVVKEALAAAVEAFRQRKFAGRMGEGWRSMVAALGGETPPELSTLAKLRTHHPVPFRHLRRLAGKRDARLWLESLLLALRPLGFPGVLLILDEHDSGKKALLDRSIVQLRHQLDRLAEGHLPGTFVLYLVLDDFPSRVHDSHSALEQRISPIIQERLPSRLMTELSHLRDLQGAEFLEAIAEHLHGLVREVPPPKELARKARELAQKHKNLGGGADTRAFVKSFVQLLAVDS